jgi:hypothetical protein
MIRDRATVTTSWPLWLLLALLPVACARTSLTERPSAGGPHAEGATLRVGDRQFRLDACISGDLEHFLGVDLADRQGGAIVRVAIDPIDGPRIRVLHDAGGSRQRLDLTPGRCGQFAADARPTNWIVNDVRDVSGFVDVECPGDAGPAVSLHARFSHCH